MIIYVHTNKYAYVKIISYVIKKKVHSYTYVCIVYLSTYPLKACTKQTRPLKKITSTSLIIMIIMRILSNYESYFPGGAVCVCMNLSMFIRSMTIT